MVAMRGMQLLTNSILSGYIVSQVRRLALEVRGRRFESCYPDQFLSVSKQGVGASLLTKNEWGSIPQRTASFRIGSANILH